jgi:hypothetical protein
MLFTLGKERTVLLSYLTIVYIQFASISVVSGRAHTRERIISINAGTSMKTRIRTAFVDIDSAIFACDKKKTKILTAFTGKKIREYRSMIFVPVKPGGHLQTYLFWPLKQAAPFKHGCDKHSSTSMSQKSPVYPGMQKH